MKKKRTGVITVEASIVMPIVIGVIFLLYTLAIVHYNNIAVRAEAMRVANRVATNWNIIGGDGHNILDEDTKITQFQEDEKTAAGKTGKNAISSQNYTEHDPYRHIVQLFTIGSTRKQNIEDYLKYRVNTLGNTTKGLNLVTETEEYSSKKQTGIEAIFGGYVEIAVNNSYNGTIFDDLERILNYTVNKDYRITAKAKFTEPVEFVRNISFVQEVIENMKK